MECTGETAGQIRGVLHKTRYWWRVQLKQSVEFVLVFVTLGMNAKWNHACFVQTCS